MKEQPDRNPERQPVPKQGGAPRSKPRVTLSFAGLAALIAAAFVLYFGSLAIIRSGIGEEELPAPVRKGLAPSLGEIALDAGDVILAEDEAYTAVLNTETLNVRIRELKTGRLWDALSPDERFPAAARSPIVIRYLGKDNAFYEWDAYTNVIAAKHYAIERIENGVRLRFDFREEASCRLGEYMPERISTARYEEAFLRKLDSKIADGTVSEDRASVYRGALGAVYATDESNSYYYNKFAGLPPASVVKLLIELSRELDYTTGELFRDSEEFGIAVAIREQASFTVYMELTFQDGELRVNIPVYEQRSGNDFYTLQNISVFPAFDCAAAENNSGFIFVPDGAGMLFALDSYNGKYPEYNRPLYNNGLFSGKFEKSAFDEELHVPVFGMYRSDESGRQSGFMAVIESGAETARIAVTLKSRNSGHDGALYNAVSSQADTMQYSRVKIFGPYNENDARYLAATGPILFDYTLRYRFYADNADYYAFAKDYRRHLAAKHRIAAAYDNRPRLFLEIAGAITIRDTFLGVPYHPTISMTTCRQAMEILDDLSGVPLVVNYKYGLNGGRMNFFGDKADPVRVNGSPGDLAALLSRSSSGNEIFMEASLMRVYRKQKIYDDKRFYALGYDGAPDRRSAFNDLWYPDMTYYNPYDYSRYYLVHPRRLPSLSAAFLKAAEQYPNMYLTDFGSHYYGNYNPRDIVDPVTANEGAVIPALGNMAAKKTVALDNPNADRLAYAAYALNVSRESSNYGVSYTSVPFRQLVMSGLTAFTTLDVNGARSPPAYFLLQALELGALPKFTVFAEKADVLMEAKISRFFAAEYAHAAPSIKSLYAEYRAAFNQIGTKEIIRHETLESGVFMTTYVNGVKVLVNYNLYEISSGAYRLGPLDYLIIPRVSAPPEKPRMAEEAA